MKKKLVISAVNIVDGGALTVLNQCIDTLLGRSFEDLDVYLILSSKAVIESQAPDFSERFKLYFYPSSKKSWLIRVLFEYIFFYFLSLKIKPNVWLSLHDVTPNVKCENRFVYCHNPSVFVDVPFRDILKDPKQFIFSLVYGFFYKINIKRNKNIIVQQQWMADEFTKMFAVSNVIVARPVTEDEISDIKCDYNLTFINAIKQKHNLSVENKKLLFYPAFPRYFKNHKLLFSTGLLTHEFIDFYMTVDEHGCSFIDSMMKLSENKKRLGLKFTGRLSREEVYSYYFLSDALVFPSLMETWGLPISEYKKFNKPIFAPELPYAYETVGEYNNVYWFDPLSPKSLSAAIDRWLQTGIPDGPRKTINSHFCLDSWHELLEYIIR